MPGADRDFSKSIDGLSILVERELTPNPFGSALSVFINRGRNKIKALYSHRNGFCLWYKRLEAEKFASPRDGDAAMQTVTMPEFEWLIVSAFALPAILPDDIGSLKALLESMHQRRVEAIPIARRAPTEGGI